MGTSTTLDVACIFTVGNSKYKQINTWIKTEMEKVE